MSEETQDRPERAPFNMGKIAGAVALALVIVAGGLYAGLPFITEALDPCSQAKIAPVRAEMGEVAQHFDDTNRLGNQTSRGSLPPVIAELQSIRRDAKAVEVPECMAEMKSAMLDYMDAEIDAYITFLDPDVADATLYKKFDIAKARFADYTEASDEFNTTHPAR